MYINNEKRQNRDLYSCKEKEIKIIEKGSYYQRIREWPTLRRVTKLSYKGVGITKNSSWNPRNSTIHATCRGAIVDDQRRI